MMKRKFKLYNWCFLSRHFIIRATFLLLLIKALISGNLSAQVLTGVVFDKENQEPVIGAHVYLDGSSWSAVTNVDGKFEIKVNMFVYMPLVISHIVYKTVTVANPFTSLPDTIFVEEKDNMLSEVIITPDRSSRRQLLRAFRNEFLGTSSDARSCIIENEDKIELWFNERTHILSASCDEPIRIHNRSLGYKIHLILSKFEAEYTSRRLGV